MTSAPIIVTAVLGARDFAWLNALRLRHYPADRNQLDAHLTLFHHLPPSIELELRRRLAELTRQPAPRAHGRDWINLGRGVALRIDSPELMAIREDLACAFSGLLTPQDAAGWRPHVTVQNKVAPADARALQASLVQDFPPRPVAITGLAAWWYRGGPWELLSQHAFQRRT